MILNLEGLSMTSLFVSCQITDLNDHPSAHKLKVANVFDGTHSYNIVCGAKNIRPHMLTILAKVGATTHQGLTIQESNIRGVTSQGMLCSPLELGLSQEQGIVDLPLQTKLGLPLHLIDKNLLSSTPWWSYRLVEKFFHDSKLHTIFIQRGTFPELDSNFILTSETYWYDGQYHYRHF